MPDGVPEALRSRVKRYGKPLELWWRRQVIQWLAGAMRAADHWPRAARTAGPRRVLFLRPDRIGDMIVSTGVLRAIGTAPDVVLDVLAAPGNASVLQYEPSVRDVLVLNRKDHASLWQLVRSLRAREYDVIVDCMPTAPSVTTLLLMLAVGARTRVGTSGRGLDALFSPATRALPLEAHIVDHLACLVDAFRPDAAQLDMRPVLVLAPHERHEADAQWQDLAPARASTSTRPFRLLVNISAGKASRRWSLGAYAHVIAGAREIVPDLELAIISAPHERERAAELAAVTGGQVLETPTLRSAFALVATADALFTPDTSIAHAAAACRVPTVDMLLAGKASGWGLYRSPGINLESADDSLESLSADVARDALQQVLRETLAQQAAAHDGTPYSAHATSAVGASLHAELFA